MKQWQKQFSQALSYQREQKWQEALAVYHKLLQHDPKVWNVYANLGLVYQKTNVPEKAVEFMEKAVQLQPKDGQLCAVLGRLHISRNNIERGKELLEKAVSLNQQDTQSFLILARIYKDEGKRAEAERCYRQVTELQPQLAEPYAGLGLLCRFNQKLDDAIRFFRRAVELAPESYDYHGYLLEALLYSGNLYEGFIEFEWRKKRPKRQAFYEQFLAVPQWRGEIFSCKKLLVHCEEGLGDTLQFARYLSLVKSRGGHVTLACQQPLVRLFHSLSGVDEVVNSFSMKDFDYSVSLLSLPLIFGTTLATIPNSVPYLFADPKLAWQWKQKLAEKTGYKIGLVWSGNSHHSTKLADLSALAMVPNATFYSLQMGDAVAQAKNPPAGLPLIDLSADIHDFADTAAIIRNLDLVVTSDTSVLHLAGAMGKPVLAALAVDSDWRWLANRTDSPWYPTLRLFRQQAADQDNWPEMYERIALELTKLTVRES